MIGRPTGGQYEAVLSFHITSRGTCPCKIPSRPWLLLTSQHAYCSNNKKKYQCCLCLFSPGHAPTTGMKLRTIPLLLLLLVAVLCPVASETSPDYSHDYGTCSMALVAWEQQALQDLAKISNKDPHELKELLFFLHVPRTGGRTYHQCLLRNLFPWKNHCEPSYDRLRYNSTYPNAGRTTGLPYSNHCRLLVSHDDYSVLSRIPLESTSVITNIRDPVDRIFSAYEFSLTVASEVFKSKRRNSTANSKNNVMNIWPWRYLVPWMHDDLVKRETARKGKNITPSSMGFLHYDASSYMMPLYEFIHQPIVMDLLHNGATFQVAGLTNNSFIEEAGLLRKCAIYYPELGHRIVDIAKRRIDRMTYVGLTEKYNDSAVLFAHAVGGQILPMGKPSNHLATKEDLSWNKSSSTYFPFEGSQNDQLSANISLKGVLSSNKNSTPIEAPSMRHSARVLRGKNFTVYELIENYEQCSLKAHWKQVQRLVKSFKQIVPVNFSLEERHQVAEDTLEAIRQLNSLDLQLHQYAQLRFSKQVSERSELQQDEQGAEDHAVVALHGHTPELYLTQSIVDNKLYKSYFPWLMFSISAGACAVVVSLYVLCCGKIPQLARYQTVNKKI